MVALSFLVVVAVASSDDAPFDAALAAEGARGLAAARTAREGSGPRSLDALGVALRVGCELRVLDGNATLELRAGRRRRRFDVAAPCAGPWPACGRGAPETPLLCAVSSPRSAARRGRAPLALVTSYSDFGFFHTFLRWALNRLCHADLRGLPTYAFVGAPLARGAPPRAPGCPSAVEERLGHTSKALSLYALGVLGVADALLFLDSDAWVAGAAFGRPFLETFAAAARGGEVALPAPCYRQFFGAAVLLATATPWAVGFLARWFRLRSAPRKRPRISRNAKPLPLGRFG